MVTRPAIRKRRLNRTGLWIPALLGLILLSAGSVLAWGSPGTFKNVASAGRCNPTEALSLFGTSLAAASLNAVSDGVTAGDQPLFASPVDPETPDVESGMLKDIKCLVHPMVHLSTLPVGATHVRGRSVPLYLTHRSLLC
jgi:hypothetical protein